MKQNEIYLTDEATEPSMAFFPTYKSQFTRTPNVFFDEILRDPKVTLNQVRLIAYLIRETIGYNREAKWTAVSRSQLIKAGIPNSRIRDTIQGCKEKQWVIVFEQGKGTKKERYIFLNDDRNQKLVFGLEQGYFTIEELQFLNLAGIDHLLQRHGMEPEQGNGNDCSSTKTGEEQLSSSRNRRSTPPETGEATTTETGEADTPSSQENQEVSSTLNTSFKDNHKKQTNRVCLLDKKIDQEATDFVNDAFHKGMDMQSCQATKRRYLEARKKGIEHQTLLEALNQTFARYGKTTSPVSVIQTVIDNHAAAEEAKKAAVVKAKEREAQRRKDQERAKAIMVAAGIDPDAYGVL